MRSSQSTSSALGGGTDSRALALAMGLGLLAGLVTGPNLTLLAVLLLVVLLNVHSRTFIFAWGAAWVLSWPMRPVTGGLGRLLLEDTWCSDALRHWDESLLPVLLDWHRYTTFGGLLFGGALAAITVWRVYSALMADTAIDHETDNEAPVRSTTMEVRFCSQLCRLLLREEVDATARARWLRPWGIPAAACCVCLVLLVASWIVPLSLRHTLIARCSQLNGAEVTAGDVQLDLSDGRLTIDDLRFADPSALDHDRWRVARVEGKLNIGLLARGRLDFSTLKLASIRENVPRAELAQLCGDRSVRMVLQELEAPVLLTPSAVELSTDAHRPEILLSTLARDWGSLAERLQLVRRIIGGVEDLRKLELVAVSHSPEFAPTRGRARFHVGELTVEGFARHWGFGPKSHFTLKHVSSDPANCSRATELHLVAPEVAAELRATFQHLEESPRHELEFDLYDLPLVRACHPDGIGRHLAVTGGVADLRASGFCDRDGLQLLVRAEARGLDARFIHGEPVAGVSSVAWNDALRRLNPLRGKFTICGKWASPRIAIDENEVLAELKGQLRAANQLALVEVFERQQARSLAQMNLVEQPATTEPFSAAATPAVSASKTRDDDRYSQWHRDQAETASAVATSGHAPATQDAHARTERVQQEQTQTASVGTVGGNALFQQMVPTTSQPQATVDGVCASCKTESDGGNYLPPGTEIHAPQVSIEGPTRMADGVPAAAPPESSTEPTTTLTTTAKEVASNEPPLPDTTIGAMHPNHMLPTEQAQAASIYRPYYATPPGPYSAPATGTGAQTVPASATAGATTSQGVAPASTASLPHLQTGYADGVAQVLPLESAAVADENEYSSADSTKNAGLRGQARAAGSRLTAWTGGVFTRMRGWWPRRTTEEERAAMESANASIDPWANDVSDEVEAASVSPAAPETTLSTDSDSSLAPATAPLAASDAAPATTLAAEPVQPEANTSSELFPASQGKIELEAQRPSAWQRMQFWRSWR